MWWLWWLVWVSEVMLLMLLLPLLLTMMMVVSSVMLWILSVPPTSYQAARLRASCSPRCPLLMTSSEAASRSRRAAAPWPRRVAAVARCSGRASTAGTQECRSIAVLFCFLLSLSLSLSLLLSWKVCSRRRIGRPRGWRCGELAAWRKRRGGRSSCVEESGCEGIVGGFCARNRGRMLVLLMCR